MADEPEIVTQEQTSIEGDVSEVGEKPAEGDAVKQTPPQPFTPEQEAKLAEMLHKATEGGMEQGRREMQGRKDREVVDAQRRAKYFEDTLSRMRGTYDNLEPEVRQTLENEELKGKVGYFEGREAENTRRQQLESQARALNESLIGHLNDLDIDASDKRVDWANDEADYAKGLARFNKSVSKILKENIANAKKQFEAEAKEKLAQERKEQGIDEVPTDIAVGATRKGIPTNKDAFRKWVAGLTDAEYKAKEPEINRMLSEGIIK